MLPAHTVRSAREILLPYVCLTRHCKRHALPGLTLSGQLLSGSLAAGHGRLRHPYSADDVPADLETSAIAALLLSLAVFLLPACGEKVAEGRMRLAFQQIINRPSPVLANLDRRQAADDLHHSRARSDCAVDVGGAPQGARRAGHGSRRCPSSGHCRQNCTAGSRWPRPRRTHRPRALQRFCKSGSHLVKALAGRALAGSEMSGLSILGMHLIPCTCLLVHNAAS
jgi:hypothetical protein